MLSLRSVCIGMGIYHPESPLLDLLDDREHKRLQKAIVQLVLDSLIQAGHTVVDDVE